MSWLRSARCALLLLGYAAADGTASLTMVSAAALDWRGPALAPSRDFC